MNLDVNQDGSAVDTSWRFYPEEMDVYAITNFYGNDNTVSTHEFNSLLSKVTTQIIGQVLASKLSRRRVASKDALFAS